MARAKNPPVFKYGIEITKPFSEEMYEHNSRVMEDMKFIIKSLWSSAYVEAEKAFEQDLEEDQQGLMFGDHDWSNADNLMVELCKAVTVTHYRNGFTVDDVQDEFFRDLDTASGWRMHQLYQELCEDGIVGKLKFEILGFTDNYNKDYPSYAIGVDSMGNELLSPISS